MRRFRPVALLLSAVLAAAPSVALSAPGGVDAKRRLATQLQAEIERQGEKLSIATEEFDAAQLRREQVDLKIARARKQLTAAEDRWEALKSRLGERVRVLYMHPGLWAAPLFNMRSFNDFSRGRVLAGSVLITDTDLILQTEKARADITARKADLENVRVDARSEEKDMDAKRAAVEKQLNAQKALLSQVQGDIASILEQERQRRLAAAVRRAGSGRGNLGLPAPHYAGPVRPTAAKAVATADAQIGKPYQWGASGPDSFDCSGLTMYAWGAAGVSLPHSAQAQYSSLPHVAFDQIQPGDLLFYGSPIHHVGIYEGGGVMVHAPETGESVRRDSAYRGDFAGAARP